MKKILFLDQSGKPGGAELCLMDLVEPYKDSSLVGLFEDGPFKSLLEKQQIPVRVLGRQAIKVRKESRFWESLGAIGPLIPTIAKVVQLSRSYDLIYANTQKALVVGALASWFGRRPLVYHLHDILSADHFSLTNRRLAVTLANRFAALVIANSQATKLAFIEAGGRSPLTEVVYNGFKLDLYDDRASNSARIRQELGLSDRFVVGHFSRLSPWKGQHVLIEALTRCPERVTAILVGDALFGEADYAQQLHRQVAELGLENRVKFLGFRSDVVALMKACDLVVHTSTAPEPFGRVIVEAMLCSRPVIAAQSGGALELVEDSKTGWLVPPGDAVKLAAAIDKCYQQPELSNAIARQAQICASQTFDIDKINQQIDRLLSQLF
jgi:glycosyltransferase involved in cell wall biosynthesis